MFDHKFFSPREARIFLFLLRCSFFATMVILLEVRMAVALIFLMK
jgi:hypothetical protein